MTRYKKEVQLGYFIWTYGVLERAGRSPIKKAPKGHNIPTWGRALWQKKRSPRACTGGPKKRRRPTLPLGVAVPSAQTGLTSLFGMVRGGPRRHGHLRTYIS